VDRWILERLDEVVRECRAAYEAFEFHKVYHVLNQFCAVDLSSLYIDITKDRMYCDAPDSPRRRATQAVMHEIFGALCRLLAPITAKLMCAVIEGTTPELDLGAFSPSRFH